MNQTKQTSKPFALLTWLLVLAVTCVMALAATSCDSGDKDEPKEPDKEVTNENPRDVLPNHAYNLDQDYGLNYLEDKNIKTASFFFLPNGNVLQRIVYKTGKPTETIRCFSYDGRYYESGNIKYIDLFLASGTKFCEFTIEWPGINSDKIPNLKASYELDFREDELTMDDMEFIETYSSMKVGEIKEIGGSGSGSSSDDTPTIDSRIIGTWEYNEDGDIYRLTFYKSGYVEERTNADNYEDFTFHKFSFDGKKLTLPDDTPFSNNWGTNFTVTFSGSYMTLTNSLTTSSGVTVRFRKKN